MADDLAEQMANQVPASIEHELRLEAALLRYPAPFRETEKHRAKLADRLDLLATRFARESQRAEDTQRLDWLEGRAFTAYRTLDPVAGPATHVVVCNEHEEPRRGHVAATLREAVDVAREHEAKGARSNVR